jgi:methylmalonyl-CoA/ethylmalonyl-CoA epimerase
LRFGYALSIINSTFVGIFGKLLKKSYKINNYQYFKSKFTMKPTHIEHLGIAVSSLEQTIPFFEFLTGSKCYSIEEVADQKVKTAFFKVGETKIELLEPTCPESTIAKFIEKNGGRGGVHHVAFNVENVEEALKEAEAAGIQLIDKAPRKGAENLMIGFLHPKSTCGVLMELCEQPK